MTRSPEQPADIETVPVRFDRLAREAPDSPAFHYFGHLLTRRQARDLSARVATVLRQRGIGAGDRVVVSLQNTPVFAVTVLAAWRLNAIVVPVTPMLAARELRQTLLDSDARVVVVHPEQEAVVGEALEDTHLSVTVLLTPASDLAGDLPATLQGRSSSADPTTHEFLLEVSAGLDPAIEVPATLEDTAFIVYTSGTTGPSKGAVITHRNIRFQADAYRDWWGLDETTVLMTVSPLSHISGLVANLVLSLSEGYPLIFTHRFHAPTALRLIKDLRPTILTGAITAFTALLADDTPSTELPHGVLGTLPLAYTGGAPVPAKIIDRYSEATGRYVHNMYGLTETSSACIGVPVGEVAPVDPETGVVSVGIAMPGARVSIVDDDGVPVGPGERGEIMVGGPQLASGYWGRPEETAREFLPKGFRTGDIGSIDERGWVYVLDRKKDLIVASGYKVWPQEVEEVIYQHPRVREAAVVALPDEYRGETVCAVISIIDAAPDETELREWCKARLSAYKVPVSFVIREDLPKSSSGKILRRLIREELQAARHT